MKRLLKYFFIVVLVSGCSAYPIKKDNVLTTPSQFKVKVLQDPNKTKEMIIEDVMSNFAGLDEIGSSEIKRYASKIYDEKVGRPNLDGRYLGDIVAKSVINK